MPARNAQETTWPSLTRNRGGRPHVLVLTPAADMYGSDRSLLLALPALLERFSLTLVSAADGPMLAEARALGVRTIVSLDWALRRRNLRPEALPRTARQIATSLTLLRRLHREERFALVYANTTANALLPFLRLAVPVPLVLHVREVPRDRAALAKLLLRAVDRTADRVLCNSSFTASLVLGVAPQLRSRLRTVPNGIEPPQTAAPAHDDGVMDVVCVGRIHPKKGQGVLIEAARLAALEGHRWRLHFWGDALTEHEPLAASLRDAVAEAGLGPTVTWHGYGADPSRLYDQMDVAVVPSVLPEEFSLVTAEAQAAGLPVVATGPGGPSDIVIDGQTGRIVPAADAGALAAALIELEDADLRRRWGSSGRARVLEHFTVDRYAPAVADELADVLQASQPALDLR